MRPSAINSAEAIFEPFFDPQRSGLAHWQCDWTGITGGKIWQNWAWVQWSWERPAPDGTVLRFRRTIDLPCAGYDRLLFTTTLPEGATLTIAAETDAGPRRRTGEPFGPAKREEWLPLDGATRVTALSLEARLPTPRAGNGWFLWAGLQSTARLADHLAQWRGYDERWEGYLQPPDFQPTFRPRHGLLVSAEELAELRTALAGSPDLAALREAAADAAAVQPEELIGEWVNFWNSNTLRRERDHGKMITVHGPMAAQASVLLEDAALGRLAARFALALAHCGRWDDAPMCYLPGGAWEQRSFVQSVCAWETAVILDLCGEWFTPLGREVILRRIAEEAMGHLNFNTWWWEYLFHCNQIAWFAPGRILGYLLLERELPGRRGEGFPPRAESRVRPYTEIAVRDLQENLAHILLPDGGYVEGPTYFTWVARQAILALHLYARARGLDENQLLPPALRATERLAEVLYSTADDQDTILVCDAMFSFPEGVALLAAHLPDTHWVNVYRKQLRRAGAAPSLLALARGRTVPAEGPPLSPFVELPATGYAASVRRHGDETVKLLVLGNKGGAGHTHEDKGSFVLEFAGDSFAMDFGVVDYSNPITEELKWAQRHNMLTPWSDGERPRPQNPIAADLRPVARGDEHSFHAKLDLAAGWEGWFRRWRRTWDSPAPDRLVIEDDWEIDRGLGVVFHWTTPLPIRLGDGRAVIEGRRGVAEIAIPPGVEAAVEQLPLMDPSRRATDEMRRELVRFGRRHGTKQPRLALRQRGARGVLRVEVRLRPR